MSDLPNLDRLERRARFNRIDVSTREIQVLNIRHDYEKPARGTMHQVDKDARMVGAVPALLTHIDELHGRVYEVLEERDKARAEVTQIALDTSPAYAQLRDERDSARRERDEAIAKQSKAVAAELDSIIRDERYFTPAGEVRPTEIVKRIQELEDGAR